MSRDTYRKLRELSRMVASTLPEPAFYGVHGKEIRRANETLSAHELIQKCRVYLDESQLECAHGIYHCEAVARDAGAIVLVEAKGGKLREDGDLERLFISAVIAGLLHDIKRKEKDHALLGSIEAERILSIVGMEKKYLDYITYAIRNHEAFKQTCDLDDKAGCLVSDALYDADKFRWGPENFTTTLWLMVEAHNMPLETLHRTFKEKMKGIEKIKETFRTATGRSYGPEFIDQGTLIGDRIYEEMTALLQNR